MGGNFARRTFPEGVCDAADPNLAVIEAGPKFLTKEKSAHWSKIRLWRVLKNLRAL